MWEEIQEKPRLTWIKNIINWTAIDSNKKVKRAAEERQGWRTMIAVNLLEEDDTL